MIPLSVVEYGNGPAVVLLHAFPLDGRMWKGTAESLASEGFRAVIPDFPGFGKSELPNDVSASLDYYAGSINEQLVQMNITRAHFCGLSMGGYVLFRLLKQAPESFLSITLCDTTSKADSPEKRVARGEMALKVADSGVDVLTETMLPNLVSPRTLEARPRLMAEIKRLIHDQSHEAISFALEAMAARPDSTPLLSQLDLPALLLFGESDAITGAGASRQLLSDISGAVLKNVPDAGHYSNLENPEFFSGELISFLKSQTLSC